MSEVEIPAELRVRRDAARARWDALATAHRRDHVRDVAASTTRETGVRRATGTIERLERL